MQTKAQTQNKNISYLCDKAFPTKQSQMPFEMQWKSACGGDCVQKFDSSQIWLGLAQNNLNAKELVDWAQPSFLIFVLDFKKKEHVQWMLTIP